MSRFGGWLRATVKDDGLDDETALDQERKDMEEAMAYAELIMNDDVDGAYAALSKGKSSFHLMGAAVTFFMRSVLGFEKSVMMETAERLGGVEPVCWEEQKRAEKRGRGDGVYPPGTEYELVRAEMQIMGAVVGVLHESVVEAMKSFYKLRKAFITLDGIAQMEKKALGGVNALPTEIKVHTPAIAATGTNTPREGNASDPEYVDAKPLQSGMQTPADFTTATATPDHVSLKNLSLQPTATKTKAELNLTDPIDVFIHSGNNMCFGILLTMLTLVPPAFGRILSVVGFRGDRARGVSMLWAATAHPNVNGAIAGMVLLGYYNGLLGTVDILPHERDFDDLALTVGPPKKKCDALLATMRTRYPESRLWRIEEARQLASERRIPAAIEIFKSGYASQMKQVMALNDFELACNCMYVGQWTTMRDTFLRCLEINEWSPSMYTYLVGCASLELYRDAVQAGDETEARKHKKDAEGYLKKAPTLGNKRKFMARQLPFEVFLTRKVKRWEDRAEAMQIDFCDGIGVSPATELGFMFNGIKKMSLVELEAGMKNFAWNRCTGSEEVVAKIRAEIDEVGMWALVMASMTRASGDLEGAKALLAKEIIKHDPALFKGPEKNDYVPPAAHYELAVIAWEECCNPPADQDNKEYRRKKYDECAAYLDKTKNWEAYVPDARIGLRVQSGLETLSWFKKSMGWA